MLERDTYPSDAFKHSIRKVEVSLVAPRRPNFESAKNTVSSSATRAVVLGMATARILIGQARGAPRPPALGMIPNTARYAADFEAYLVALIGFAVAAEAWNSGQAKPYKVDDTALIDCKQDGARWEWHPHDTVSLLSLNQASVGLRMARTAVSQPPPNAVLQLGAIGRLLHTMGQALATNYYERNVSIIVGKYRNEPTNWPAVWNFARVVRNAMAHGGKIHFLNPNAAAVSWKGLIYEPSMNGRHILQGDLWPGDLFDLIIEMDGFL